MHLFIYRFAGAYWHPNFDRAKHPGGRQIYIKGALKVQGERTADVCHCVYMCVYVSVQSRNPGSSRSA